jgi:hypothetical protein
MITGVSHQVWLGWRFFIYLAITFIGKNVPLYVIKLFFCSDINLFHPVLMEKKGVDRKGANRGKVATYATRTSSQDNCLDPQPGTDPPSPQSKALPSFLGD